MDDLKSKLASQEVELAQKNEAANKLIQVVGAETEKVSHYANAFKNHSIHPKALLFRVPTGTGKPIKMGRRFPVREKSRNFEQTGKVRENHTK